MDRKAQIAGLGALPSIVIAAVLAVIVLGLGGTILADIQGDAVAGSAAYNTTAKGSSMLTKLSNQLPTIGTVIGAGIVIAALGIFAFTRIGR